MPLNGGNHRTTRFAGMFAVAVAASGGSLENLGEIMRHLFRLEVDGAESAHSGYIDNFPSSGQRHHLGECCGMRSGVMDVGDSAGLQSGAGHNGIYKR